jgi:Icc-related predicted phosphoesterase
MLETANSIPDHSSDATSSVRITAIADLHYGRHPADQYPLLLARAAAEADVLAICGDLTDHGRVEEAQGLLKALTQSVHVPIVAVLGNHDYEAGQDDAVRQTLRDGGLHLLDGDAIEIAGVGFAGVKGFGGGFGARALGPWGESIIKAFVQESIAEALKLEAALARLRSTARVALLHYAPVASTVEGEPLEVYPFLGSTRLEDPLVRYEVDVVFHGHAHHGQPEGRTSAGAPVFNVSWPLLQRTQPDRPFRTFTLAKRREIDNR